jgi:hypothetical protein
MRSFATRLVPLRYDSGVLSVGSSVLGVVVQLPSERMA